VLLGLLSRITALRNSLVDKRDAMLAAGAPLERAEEPEPGARLSGLPLAGQSKSGGKLKVIIMSATLRVSDFTQNPRLFPVPPLVLEVPSRQYPVATHFSRVTTHDYVDKALQKVSRIHARLPPGAILVFLTGRQEIEDFCRELEKLFPPPTPEQLDKLSRERNVEAAAAAGLQAPDAPALPAPAAVVGRPVKGRDGKTILGKDGQPLLVGPDGKVLRTAQSTAAATAAAEKSAKKAEKRAKAGTGKGKAKSLTPFSEAEIRRDEAGGHMTHEDDDDDNEEDDAAAAGAEEGKKKTGAAAADADAEAAALAEELFFELSDDDDYGPGGDEDSASELESSSSSSPESSESSESDGAAGSDTEAAEERAKQRQARRDKKSAELAAGVKRKKGESALDAEGRSKSSVSGARWETERAALLAQKEKPPMVVLPLFALLPTEQQMRVFAPSTHNCGARVVVVSTNVAETSVTIPNVRYVVDTGREKTKLYDQTTGSSRFAVGFISQAAANQRAGRAGRTGPGHAYRLYSGAVYGEHFPVHTAPEILRQPIEATVLQMKSMGIRDVAAFPFPSPPPPIALREATRTLHVLGALAVTDPALARRLDALATARMTKAAAAIAHAASAAVVAAGGRAPSELRSGRDVGVPGSLAEARQAAIAASIAARRQREADAGGIGSVDSQIKAGIFDGKRRRPLKPADYGEDHDAFGNPLAGGAALASQNVARAAASAAAASAAEAAQGPSWGFDYDASATSSALDVTSSGRAMSLFPLHPRFAKMLMMAANQGVTRRSAAVAASVAMLDGEDETAAAPGEFSALLPLAVVVACVLTVSEFIVKPRVLQQFEDREEAEERLRARKAKQVAGGGDAGARSGNGRSDSENDDGDGKRGGGGDSSDASGSDAGDDDDDAAGSDDEYDPHARERRLIAQAKREAKAKAKEERAAADAVRREKMKALQAKWTAARTRFSVPHSDTLTSLRVVGAYVHLRATLVNKYARALDRQAAANGRAVSTRKYTFERLPTSVQRAIQQKLAAFCADNFIRTKAITEVLLLRDQLTRVVVQRLAGARMEKPKSVPAPAPAPTDAAGVSGGLVVGTSAPIADAAGGDAALFDDSVAADELGDGDADELLDAAIADIDVGVIAEELGAAPVETAAPAAKHDAEDKPKGYKTSSFRIGSVNAGAAAAFSPSPAAAAAPPSAPASSPAADSGAGDWDSARKQLLSALASTSMTVPTPLQELALTQILLTGFADKIARKMSHETKLVTIQNSHRYPQVPMRRVKAMRDAAKAKDDAKAALLAGVRANAAVAAPPMSAEEIEDIPLDLMDLEGAYETLDGTGEPVFLAPDSVLGNQQPEYVCFHERSTHIGRRNRTVLSGLTAVKPEWFSTLLPSMVGLVSFSAPLEEPAPAWDAASDRVIHFVSATLGPKLWPLPHTRRQYEDFPKTMPVRDASGAVVSHKTTLFKSPVYYKHLARLLLEGQVLPALRVFRPFYVAKTTSPLATPTPAIAMRLVEELRSNNVRGASDLRRLWVRSKQSGKLLLEEYLAFVHPSKKVDVMAIWPPLR
jgi:HrpA-like RNA helicase